MQHLHYHGSSIGHSQEGNLCIPLEPGNADDNEILVIDRMLAG